MSTASKALYKPLALVSSVAGALLASEIFARVWKKVGDSDQEPPEPKDLNRSGREALSAAALQGLIFGLTRAAVDRASAHGYRAVTNEDPQ
ncbi:DUF4235 domain-containing protein [Micromonospora sp. WMMD736]|uniref:DUF4235 domain-containing protein n=1 Tax=Micromonospora sp. WMMD736 TaxID=3404112 RepID=UPI003B93EF68